MRYDEQGDYVKHWLPELAAVPADKIQLVSNLTADEQAEFTVTLGSSYPLPVINPNQWLTEEKHR
jgi:deoxyribodipyrimidine photo-lyase